MIDFSCCEVHKAIKAFYSDNQIISINPIIKSMGQPFANKGNTVYYGVFTNPKNSQTALYKGGVLGNDGTIIFNQLESPSYDFFQGYEIRLQNTLDMYIPKVIINFLFDASYQDDESLVQLNTSEINGNLEILNGYAIPVKDFPKPDLPVYADLGAKYFSIGNSAPGQGFNIDSSHFVQDGLDFRVDVTWYDMENYVP